MGELMAVIAGFGMIFMLISFGLSILMLVATWMLFEKAGEPGWKMLIPVYNGYIMAKIGTGKGWLIFAPFIGGILSVMAGEGIIALIVILAIAAISIYIQFSFIKRFADTGMAVASMFVPVIIYPIVAFSDKYVYDELV